MAASDKTLQRMLSGELPLDRVGPHLRHACRRALHSGDRERMKLAAKVVIAELLRRGELVKVSIDEATAGSPGRGPFCMVKGSRRLLDLSFLGREASHLAGRTDFPVQVAEASEPSSVPPTPGPNLEEFAGILRAMEQAQDLEIGDPRSGEKVIILASILRLLERFLPQFPLFILLHGTDPVPEDLGQLFTMGTEGASGGWLAVRTPGHSVWIPNPDELPEHIRNRNNLHHEASTELAGLPFRNAVAVPLWEPSGKEDPSSPAKETGLLFLVTGADLGRDPMLRMAERLSRFVTRRWRHQQEVNQRIHVDGLTGVYNRAFFDSQFTLELERARRSEIPLTLVIADLDKFKDINDTHGHPAGDAALRMVARRLLEELRRIDHICRIGGEEFALILPDTSQEAAQEVMGRLLDSKFITSVSSGGNAIDVKVTFSFGAVTFPAAGADPFELYRKADAMLFLSKDLGRHRCHFWNNDGDHLQLLPSASDD
jgi:diguanylate cyclase (GGDEF)-like protein